MPLQHSSMPQQKVFGTFAQQQRVQPINQGLHGVVGRRPQSSRTARAASSARVIYPASDGSPSTPQPPPSVHLDKAARAQLQSARPPPMSKESPAQRGEGTGNQPPPALAPEGAASRPEPPGQKAEAFPGSEVAEPWNCPMRERGKEPDDLVNIKVYDERRKVTRDFLSQRTLLMDSMGYFQKYLAHVAADDDIDIEVHCDVGIFEWLMKYIHAPVEASGDAPKLSAESVVSIMVSSDFLEMPALVQECLAFLKLHIGEVVKVPLDLSCVTAALTHRLAELLSDVELDAVQDDEDRLLGKLYMHKLEALLDNDLESTTAEDVDLHKCARCGALFTKAQLPWLLCPKSPVEIDFHGSAVARHEVCVDWDIQQYLVRLRRRRLSWKRIYWRMWGTVHHLPCTVCKTRFPLWQYQQCSYHPFPAEFEEGGDNYGTYRCCGAQAMRFSTGLRTVGCQAKQHSVGPQQGMGRVQVQHPGRDEVAEVSPQEEELLQKLQSHIELATVPFDCPHDPFTCDSSSDSDAGTDEDEAVEVEVETSDTRQSRPGFRANSTSTGGRRRVSCGPPRRKGIVKDTAQGKKKGRPKGGFKPEVQREEDMQRLEALMRDLEGLRDEETTATGKELPTIWTLTNSATPAKERGVCALPPRLGARAFVENQIIRAGINAAAAAAAVSSGPQRPRTTTTLRSAFGSGSGLRRCR